MIVKLKYCIIRFYMFYFLNVQLTFQFRIFHFQVSCETALRTIRMLWAGSVRVYIMPDPTLGLFYGFVNERGACKYILK